MNEQVSGRRLAGLDGIRASAVLTVIAYHIWPDAVPGGFIGVSVFFALSGYLITSLLLAEHTRSGRISLHAFWVRRFRRIAPPLAVTVAAVTAWAALTRHLTSSLAGQLAASLVGLGNWAQLLSGHRYGDPNALSAVQHLWSLGVEEQVYLVLPFVLVVCLRYKRPTLVLTGVCLAAIGTAGWLTLNASQSFVYYATPVRAAEVLVGALAAVWLPAFRSIGRRGWLAAAVSGGVLVAATVWLTDDSSLIKAGALLGCGIAAAVLVSTAARLDLLGRLLDGAPLRVIGKMSYTAYLAHWPLVVATADMQLPAATRATIILGGTAAICVAVSGGPRRQWSAVAGSRTAQGIVAAATTVTAAALIFAPHAGAGTDFEAASADFNVLTHANTTRAETSTVSAFTRPHQTSTTSDVPTGRSSIRPHSTETSATAPTTIADRPLTIGFFGDSKALSLGLGVSEPAPLGFTLGSSWAALGCPTIPGGTVRDISGLTATPAPQCDWSKQIPDNALGKAPLDVAIVWLGTWDIRVRNVAGVGCRWCTLPDPTYTAALSASMRTLANTIITNNVAAARPLITSDRTRSATMVMAVFSEYSPLRRSGKLNCGFH